MISIVVLTHNRLASLQQCIKSIQTNTTVPYELIVVNNASTDGTSEFMSSTLGIHKGISLAKNEGVIARNHGFKEAKYPFIAQIDDDVIMHPNWDINSLKYFKLNQTAEQVGMVGPQGGLIPDWLDLKVFEHNTTYVDFLTGFYMMFRNCGIVYDTTFGTFWHEELDLSLQFKSKGFRLRVVQEPVCTHVSQRTAPIDWELHDKNLNYVKNKWKNRLAELRLGGY